MATHGPRLSAVLLVAVTAAACSGSSTSPTPAPAGASQARITVTAQAPVVTRSTRVGFAYRVTVSATITESAGLGANINFVRLRQTLLGVEIERAEITANDILSSSGTNRLNANATRNVTLTFDVNDGRATGAVLTFGFTDDRSNVLSSDFTLTY